MSAKFEDILIVLIFALAAWGLTGCYHYSTETTAGKAVFVDMVDPTLGSASVKDILDVRSYEFIGTGKNGEVCTTYKHQYETHAELCLGLQIDGWNNAGCAVEKRKEQFGTACPKGQWDHEAATVAWEKIIEDKFTCFAGHKGKNDVNAQGTVSPRIILPHTDFVAVAKKIGHRDQFSTHLELSLEIQDMGGNTLVRKDGSWKLDSLSEAEPLQVYSRHKNAILICWPGILSQLPAGRLPR